MKAFPNRWVYFTEDEMALFYLAFSKLDRSPSILVEKREETTCLLSEIADECHHRTRPKMMRAAQIVSK